MHIHSCSCSYLWMIIHKVIKNTVYRPKGQLMCSSMRCKQTFFKKKRKEKENDFDQENISTSAIKTWTRSCLEGNMSQCKISLTEVGKTKKRRVWLQKEEQKKAWCPPVSLLLLHWQIICQVLVLNPFTKWYQILVMLVIFPIQWESSVFLF